VWLADAADCAATQSAASCSVASRRQGCDVNAVVDRGRKGRELRSALEQRKEDEPAGASAAPAPMVASLWSKCALSTAALREGRRH
jgi:hypothetical protein